MSQDGVSMENTQEDMSSQNVMDFGATTSVADKPDFTPGEEGTAEVQCHNGQKSSKRPNSPEHHLMETGGAPARASNPRHALHLSCSPKNVLGAAPDDVAMLSPESPVCKRLPDSSPPDKEHQFPVLAANTDHPGVLEPESGPPVTSVGSRSLSQDTAQAVAPTLTKASGKQVRVGSSRANHDSTGRHTGTTSKR